MSKESNAQFLLYPLDLFPGFGAILFLFLNIDLFIFLSEVLNLHTQYISFIVIILTIMLEELNKSENKDNKDDDLRVERVELMRINRENQLFVSLGRKRSSC